MRQSTCARLYFEGCNFCNPPYTDFVGSKPTFHKGFQTGKQTIKVRSGCTLTIFPQEDHDGDEIVVDDSEDVCIYIFFNELTKALIANGQILRNSQHFYKLSGRKQLGICFQFYPENRHL